MAHAARHARPVRRSRWRPVLGAVLAVTLGLGAWLLITSTEMGAPPAAVAAPAAAPAALGPVGSGPSAPTDESACPLDTGACVDLDAHTAWLKRGGRIVHGPVKMLPGTETGRRAPGPRSTATPTGKFHVQRKDANAVSSENGEPMPHAVYFAPGGIAFHEGSLSDTSNGCIHLSPSDAKTFYDALGVGEPVTVF